MKNFLRENVNQTWPLVAGLRMRALARVKAYMSNSTAAVGM